MTLPPHSLRALTAHIVAHRFKLENERIAKMSQLTERLELARGVVARQTAKIRARADAIIAEEPVIEAMTDDAFAGHETMLAEARKGLDALKRELALVSNDPLGNSSDGSPEVEPPVVQPFRAAE